MASGAVSAETRLRLAAKAFAHTAQYDAAVASYLGAGGTTVCGRVPGSPRAPVPQAARPALRGEPAPAGRVLCRGRRAGCVDRFGVAAAGQGALVQQPRRRRHRVRVRAAVRRARLRDRQAREPLRRRRRDGHRPGLRPRVQDRSHLGVRRHHRLQPAARRRRRPARSSSASSSRSSSRPGSTRRPVRPVPARRTSACSSPAGSQPATRASRSAASTAACWSRRATRAWSPRASSRS